MNKLPDFSVDSFKRLLIAFADSGYCFSRIISPSIEKQTVYIRHDVDFFIGSWEHIPILEAEMDVPATYYFLPIAYNFFHKEVRDAIKQVYDLGHDVGLHFDMRHYSEDPEKARKSFNTEVKILEDIIEGKVCTVVRHQPGIWKKQPFDISDYVDPYSKAWLNQCTYISESCRAWRDDTLLQCFGETPPFQVQLATHPEQWIAPHIESRLEYIDTMRYMAEHNFTRRFVRERKLWKIHEGGIAHDKRESCNNNLDGKL